MKKFYSIFALVAMMCSSLFVATSCSNEEEPKKLDNMIIVNAYYDASFSASKLSQTTDQAVGTAMHNVQARLGLIEFTTRDEAETLLHQAVDDEMDKIADESKYELYEKGAKLYFSVQKCNPAVEYLFDCSALNVKAPVATFTLKSAQVNEGGLNFQSESTKALLRQAAEKLNASINGKSVETTISNSYNDMFKLALKELPAELVNSIKSCPEANGDNRFMPLIDITYSSTYIGYKGQDQIVSMNFKSFEQ